MTELVKETIQAEVASLQAQLDLIEERAAALRATIAQYKEAALTEQQTAQEAKEIALSALAAAQAAQEQVQATQEQIAALPTVETPYAASPEDEDEVEIELVYEEEEETNEEETEEVLVETPFCASPEEDNEVEIELIYAEEEEEKEEKSPLVVEVEKSATTANLLPSVEDIRKAISLGDRFLFQRELFAGNGELMNKTIDKLNTLSSLDEALEYIANHFSWDTDTQAYELFTNILKRRW